MCPRVDHVQRSSNLKDTAAFFFFLSFFKLISCVSGQIHLSFSYYVKLECLAINEYNSVKLYLVQRLLLNFSFVQGIWLPNIIIVSSKIKSCSIPKVLHIVFIPILYWKNTSYSCALSVQDIFALVRWSLPWR